MKRSSEFNSKGILYLISSPIGNLKDFSFRAIETLKSLGILYCEDTRVTSKLLSHYDIKLTLDSYHDFSDSSKEEKIINELKEGKIIGLISDAGTPIISDPGYEIVKKAIENEIKVYHIPGASAQVSSLILSTLPPKPYLFYGFLDKQQSKKKKELEELSNYPFTIVFYESPLRLKSTLKLMYEVLGDRKASISREITKLYEETIYLNLSEYESLDENLKGEIVICISPCLKEAVSIDYKKEMDKLLSKGLKVKDAARMVADMCGISYKEIYNEYARGQK